MAHRFPVNVDLTGRRCLVVGGGVVAARKVAGLIDAGGRVTVVAPALVDDLAARVTDGSVTHIARTYQASDLAPAGGGWWLVVAATDDPAVNASVAAHGDATATWVNVVSEPDGGPVALPAVHRAGPVTLTVSTGGAHPAAASWLRDLVAARLEPEQVALVEMLADLRRERPGSRPSWQAVLDSGTLDAIREGRMAEAKERLEACLS